jgi:hypothetical protein
VVYDYANLYDANFLYLSFAFYKICYLTLNALNIPAPLTVYSNILT